MKKIILTGGGTAGHVMPHLALLPHLEAAGWEAFYIGTRQGIERDLIAPRLPYYAVSAGKLRRYFDLKNFSDPWQVLKGIFEAWRILRRLKPQLVFSKGGFVAVPVTVAAWLLGIPVILHESDLTLGLANRISLPFARQLCLTFPASKAHAPQGSIVTGTPIRAEITQGSRLEGMRYAGFSEQIPVVLIMGGSMGSAVLNEVIRAGLPRLTEDYQIIHLCGKGNLHPDSKQARYFQLEYAGEELAHLLAAASFVVSRAGANAIFELLALAKPHILVPLSKEASRGDQLSNAASFAEQGFSLVIAEEDLNPALLQAQLSVLERDQKRLISAMRASKLSDGTQNVLEVIERYSP